MIKAQTIIEYALLISIVVVGLVLSVNAIVQKRSVQDHFITTMNAITASPQK